MQTAYVEFRFFGPLNDFLRPAQQQRVLRRPVGRPAAVKDLIEACGIPHPEVALIVVDGTPVDLRYLVRGGERVGVYPRFEQLSLPAEIRLDPPLPAEPSFALDRHLGTLARHLRLLGADTAYRNDYGDAELARIAAGENRVLLTRDVGLLKRRNVVAGYWVRSNDPWSQLQEVASRFGILASARVFTRCLRCNARLQPVERCEVEELVPPRAWSRHSEFRRCPGCGRIYWKGTHYERLNQRVSEFRAVLGSTDAP